MSTATSPASSSSVPTGQGSAAAAAATALEVSTSPRPGSRLALSVSVPAGRSQSSYDAAVEKLSRTVRLPGFRKGKVPRAVLLNQIGPQRIRATALEDLVDVIFREAVVQAGVEPISRPELEEGFESLLERFAPGSDLSFTLAMDVRPTPKLRETRGLKAEAEAVAYDPGRIDELIEQSRRQLAALVPVEGRQAQLGDVVQVAFEGRFSDTDEPIERGSSDGMEVELEEGRMIPGFIEGIVGMALDETREVSCSFPDSYPEQTAAGRPALFRITLLELKTRELPALDDAFAQQASEKSTLAELRADLESRLREDAERRQRSNRHDALLQALVEQLEVELPETLIQEEIRTLVEQTAGQIAQQGMDVRKLFTPDLVRSLMDTSRPEAEQRLRARLALEALAAAEEIRVEDAAIEAKVNEVRAGLSSTSGIDPQRLRQAVADDLLREALLDWLEQNSTVTDRQPQAEESAAPAATSGGSKAAADDSPRSETAASEPRKAARGGAAAKAAKAGEA
ncbi:MAG: trigger factor [Synechococcaceae cyanobacterium]|nr:trigger factor [Synechococcaceae cyanobacterium]